MKWIIPFREEITRDLAHAQAQATGLSDVARAAAELAHEAREEEMRLEVLLRALNQIDPTTRIPEPPL